MRYYIADNHFFHTNMNTRMDKRGFGSMEEMNEYMLNQWNSRVRKNDEVVVLGDLSIGNVEETNQLINKLNGKLYLCIGNHDKAVLKKEFNRERFERIDYYIELNDNGRKVICCHYPVMCYNGQFRRDKDGNPKTYMLHGHIHFTPDVVGVEHYKEFVRGFPRISRSSDIPTPSPTNTINCFCVFSDYIPLTLDEWIEIEKSGIPAISVQHDWRYDD